MLLTWGSLTKLFDFHLRHYLVRRLVNNVLDGNGFSTYDKPLCFQGLKGILYLDETDC